MLQHTAGTAQRGGFGACATATGRWGCGWYYGVVGTWEFGRIRVTRPPSTAQVLSPAETAGSLTAITPRLPELRGLGTTSPCCFVLLASAQAQPHYQSGSDETRPSPSASQNPRPSCCKFVKHEYTTVFESTGSSPFLSRATELRVRGQPGIAPAAAACISFHLYRST